MSKISVRKLFDSRFLKSDDIGDTDMALTINRVELEDIGHGDNRDEKAVVYFDEIEKVLVLNKTNATTISRLYGDDTAEWRGKRIVLYATEVSYQGTQMMGIRVRMRPPGQDSGRSQVETKSSELWE